VILLGITSLTIMALGVTRVVAGPNFAQPAAPELQCQEVDNGGTTMLGSDGSAVVSTSAEAMSTMASLWNMAPAAFSFYGTFENTDYWTFAVGLQTKAVINVRVSGSGYEAAGGTRCGELIAPGPYIDEPNP
jgi:hypothetical protein